MAANLSIRCAVCKQIPRAKDDVDYVHLTSCGIISSPAHPVHAMVSTRSSARKPPNPARPSSAPSRLTFQPQPATVHDDPPPPHPRRSRRIKLKNAESTSSQPASPDSNQISPPALSEHPLDAKHSNDEAPEEIKTQTAHPHIHPAHRQALQSTIKKNRHRRHRIRNRRKKQNEPPPLEPVSLPSQHESQLQTFTSVTERLSEDVIADAQNALDDAKRRGNNANQIARLENQVKHVVRPNIPQRIGRTKVALLSDPFPLTHRRANKGRKSPASFLASCIRKGPKRVPASKIAMKARSKTSVRS